MLMGAVAAAAGAKVVTVPTRASRSQSRSRSQSPPRVSSAAAAPQLAAPQPDATPLPAFVVSTEERFERAAGQARGAGFTPVRVPPVFAAGDTCGGRALPGNGHRLAFRGAWQRIAYRNASAAVFEDDILATGGASAAAVRAHISGAGGADVVFLGGDGKRTSFLTTHAIWLSPHAARQLLHYTDRCLDGPRAFVDQTIHCLCVAGRDPIMCRSKKYAWQQQRQQQRQQQQQPPSPSRGRSAS